MAAAQRLDHAALAAAADGPGDPRLRLLPVAGLAAVVAVHFFGGHPESNFHLLGVTAVFFVLRVVTLRREG